MARSKKSGRASGDVAAVAAASVSPATASPQHKQVNNAPKGGKENTASPAAGATVRRYKDSRRRLAHQSGLTSASTAITGADGLFVGPEDMDGLQDEQADVRNLDEPTMGSRLRGIRAAALTAGEDDLSGDEESSKKDGQDEMEDEDERDAESSAAHTGSKKNRAPLPPGSLSLGETLTQALHSNDTALLSSCLAHSDPTVIRLSVSRLSGPLAVRLLEHCVDRMAHGGRKSVGQLSSARARGIIEWVRATLTAHTGYLMSLPTLVQRLSLLHATLSTRLASQERLLALNGRLELVLSQIELRTAYASAQQATDVTGVRSKVRNSLKTGAKQSSSKGNTLGREWVETSSDEEEESRHKGRRSGNAMAVDSDDDDDYDDEIGGPIQPAEEEGEVQDIALGHSHSQRVASDAETDDDSAEEDDEEEDVDDDDDEEDDDDDEEDDDDDEDDDANGLLDLEAESTDRDDGDDDDDDDDDDDNE